MSKIGKQLETIHAYCSDCDWMVVSEKINNSLELEAKKHSKSEGHFVQVFTQESCWYKDGKRSAEKEQPCE